MAFFLIVPSVMVVSILLMHALAKRLRLQIYYSTLISVALLSFMIIFATVFLSPIPDKKFFMYLGGLILVSSFLLTSANNFLIKKQREEERIFTEQVKAAYAEELKKDSAKSIVEEFSKPIDNFEWGSEKSEPKENNAATEPEKPVETIEPVEDSNSSEEFPLENVFKPLNEVKAEAAAKALKSKDDTPFEKPEPEENFPLIDAFKPLEVKTEKAHDDKTAAPFEEPKPEENFPLQETFKALEEVKPEMLDKIQLELNQLETPEEFENILSEKILEPAPVEEEISKHVPIMKKASKPTKAKKKLPKPSKAKKKIAKPAPVEEEVSEPALVEEKIPKPAPVEEEVSELALVEEKILEPAPVEEKLSEPAPAEEKILKPDLVEEKIPEPDLVEEKIPEPDLVEEKILEPALIEEEVSEPALVEEKILEPALVEEKIPEPAPSEEKIPEPALVEEKIPEPAPAEEKIPEPAPVEEKLSEPIESLDNILDKAYDARAKGHIWQAIEHYRKALERYQSDEYAPFVAIDLGNIYKDNALYAKAIKTYEEALMLPAVKRSASTKKEFLKNLEYLRVVRDILLKHHALSTPFAKIPREILLEIDAEFQTTQLHSVQYK